MVLFYACRSTQPSPCNLSPVHAVIQYWIAPHDSLLFNGDIHSSSCIQCDVAESIQRVQKGMVCPLHWWLTCLSCTVCCAVVTLFKPASSSSLVFCNSILAPNTHSLPSTTSSQWYVKAVTCFTRFDWPDSPSRKSKRQPAPLVLITSLCRPLFNIISEDSRENAK